MNKQTHTLKIRRWYVSFNPDDDRWYVGDKQGSGVATFKHLRNAKYYAKTHPYKVKSN